MPNGTKKNYNIYLNQIKMPIIQPVNRFQYEKSKKYWDRKYVWERKRKNIFFEKIKQIIHGSIIVLKKLQTKKNEIRKTGLTLATDYKNRFKIH